MRFLVDKRSIVSIVLTAVVLTGLNCFAQQKTDTLNRETCISSMKFDAEGNILPVDVFEKQRPVKLKQSKFFNNQHKNNL